MPDIQFILENPSLIAEKSKQKGYEVDVPKLPALDTERRQRTELTVKHLKKK